MKMRDFPVKGLAIYSPNYANFKMNMFFFYLLSLKLNAEIGKCPSKKKKNYSFFLLYDTKKS
jgi:hypothetical protein